jgi:NitT/TauT family transport system substrate-binding protein
VRQGIGKVVLDVRRGDGPPAARRYTFAALVTRDELVTQQQEAAGAAVRGLIHAQRALVANPSLATDIGRRLFPPAEAELIAELIRRDGPYYHAQISPAMVAHLNQFARDMDLLEGDVPYVRVVAEELAPLWRESLP